MKKLLCVLCLLINIDFSYSQTSNYTLEELIFSTDKEKEAFKLYLKDSTKFLPLLTEMDGNTSTNLLTIIEAKMAFIIEKLKASKVESKKPKKQIQIVYKEVHNHLFKKYVEVIPFNKIFTTGEYNCATATAVYAIVLDHFAIPYHIKEKPNHVYLVAYPNTHKIVMETTSPSTRGAVTISEKMKVNVIDALVKDKIVTMEEVEKKGGIDQFFYAYFYSDKSIDFRSLISWLYSNEGYKYLLKEKYEASLQQIKKADYIKNSEIFKEFIVNLHIQILNESEELSVEYAKNVVNLSKFIDYNTNLEGKLFVSEHGRYINEYLINKGDEKEYLAVYDIFKSIEDSTVQTKIHFNHCDALARYYYNRGKYNTSIRYGLEGHAIMPKNIDLMNNVDNAVLQHSIKRYSADNEGLMGYIDDLMIKYPILKDRPTIQSLLLSTYLQTAYNALMTGNIVKAKEYVFLFENIYSPKINYQVQQQNVIAIYEHLGLYYFKKNQTSNARKAFKKGLSYFSNAYVLQNKLEYL